MSEERDLLLRWSARWSLSTRILAVNIFALAILAGSLLYLDSFRERLTAARLDRAVTEIRLASQALAVVPEGSREKLLARLGGFSGSRYLIYEAGGGERATVDSWKVAGPTFRLRGPEEGGIGAYLVRGFDSVFDLVVGGEPFPMLDGDNWERLSAWPEAGEAIRRGGVRTAVRQAEDGTPVFSAAVPVEGEDSVLLLASPDPELRRIVRDERLTLGFILLATIMLSVFLSVFLARTIARPLRRLARAAHRVRLGRAREVSVPLLPARRDEIGLLARAVDDMTQALRSRIDATEAFAADLTHELKNPLASLRSAVDSLERVEDPALRRQLLDVVRQDVRRLDRLIMDIAETSRLDAELSRAEFAPVDLAALARSLGDSWRPRGEKQDVTVEIVAPANGGVATLGDESRLARALDNLVDNAMSFSPPGGKVRVSVMRIGDEAVVRVEDEGPGIPPEQREVIFDRFHSLRPESEAFGRHSGLGLAIVRAIVEGHDGSVAAGDREGGRGARFVVRLPGAVE
ncbi:MAG: ATP-binding protein [Sphingomonadaceae bacterium]